MGTETERTDHVVQQLMREAESSRVEGWNAIDFVNWTLSICHGHFSQRKYDQFIQSIKNCTQIGVVNEEVLRSLGLMESMDIAMFLTNYDRLLSQNAVTT